MLFKALCNELKRRKVKKIYLIHEPEREKEANKFAKKLSAEDFIPFVAGTFRDMGESAVSFAMKQCDTSLLLCYDEQTVKIGKKYGIPFIDLTL